MSYPAEFKSKLMKGFTSILLRASAFYFVIFVTTRNTRCVGIDEIKMTVQD